MAKGRQKRDKRDLEKSYSPKELAAKLRRFADSLESGERFRIQVAGERVNVPQNAVCTIEHERSDEEEEIEFQIKWSLQD